MKRFKKLTLMLSISLVVFLVGCTAVEQVVVEPFDKSITVEKDFDDVWGTLVRFMSTNDISIQTIEKDSGLMALRGENLSSGLITQLCDAQPGFLSTISSGSASGSITVVDDDGFITVNVNTRFTATHYSGMTNPPTYSTRNCNSRGHFEKSVLGSISG